MSSLVIGCNGFLGSSLLAFARANLPNEEWIGVNRKNYDMWKSLKVKNLIWAGGMSSKIRCLQDKDECWKQNVDNLRDALYDFSCEKFIYISSYDVYPSSIMKSVEIDAQPLSDDYVSQLSWYGKSKIAGEETVKIWAGADNREYVILRCNGFVGAGLKKNVVYDLSQPEPKLYTSWDSRFQFIHTEDFARVLLTILIPNYSNEIFNLTCPDALSCIDIANILGIDIKKVKQPTDRVVPSVRAIMDVSKLKTVLQKYNVEVPSTRKAIERYKNEISMFTVLRNVDRG